MLTCLVVLLGAALYGTALPDLARELLAGHWPNDTESANQLAPEAPLFTPPLPDSWQDEGSGNAPTWPQAPHQSTPVATPGLALADASYGREPDVQYGQSTPNGFAPTVPDTTGLGGAVQASYESSADQPLAGNTAHLDAIAAGPRGQSALHRSQPGRQSHPVPNPQSPRMDDRFTYIQTRLRELGATYYLLESWGAEGEYFRFHCRMAVGGSQGYTRHFEATESDAMQAMARVLEEVESWRATP